jgi:hypothetical protein
MVPRARRGIVSPKLAVKALRATDGEHVPEPAADRASIEKAIRVAQGLGRRQWSSARPSSATNSA